MSYGKLKPLELKPPVGSVLNKNHPLSYGLVAYFPMLEGSGLKTANLCGDGNLTVAVNGSPTWVQGPFGKCLNFSQASSQSVTVANGSKLVIGTNMSMVAWIYPVSNPGNHSGIFGIRNADTATSFYMLQLLGTNTLEMRFRNSGGTAYTLSPNLAITPSKWQQIGLVYDGTNLRSYLNGIQQNTMLASGTFSDATQSLAIAINNGTNFFTGRIDNCRLYNRALTSAEVASLYTEPFAGVIAPKRVTQPQPSPDVSIAAPALNIASATVSPSIAVTVTIRVTDTLSKWWYGNPSTLLAPNSGNLSSWWYSKPPIVIGTQGTSITVNASALSITSATLAPTISIVTNATINAATLTISSAALAPSKVTTILPSALSIASAVLATTITGVANISPSVLTITSSAKPPTISGDALVLPSARTITSAVLAPTVSGSALVTPSNLTVASSTKVPTVVLAGNVTITPAALIISSATLSPTVSGAALVLPSNLSVSSATLAPVLSTGSTILVSALSVVSATLAPTVSAQGPTTTVSVGVLSISSSAKAPTISINNFDALSRWWYSKPPIVIDPNKRLGALGNWWRSQPATVIQGTPGVDVLFTIAIPANITSATQTPVLNNCVILPPALNISSAAVAMTVSIPTFVNPVALTITSATRVPTVTTTAAIISVPTLSISSAVKVVAVNTGVNLNVGTGVGYTAALDVSVTTDSVQQVAALHITSATLAPTVFVGSTTISVPALTITSAAKTATFTDGNKTITPNALTIASSTKAPNAFGGTSFPTTGILDTFNRANSASLGANWTGPSVGDSVNLEILSHAAAAPDNNYDASAWNANTFSSSHFEVYVTLNVLPGAGVSVDIWGVDSPTNATFSGYVLSIQPNISTFTLTSFNAGTPTVLGTFTQAFNANDSFGFQKLGSVIAVWYQPQAGSWTQLGSLTDSNSFGPMYLGMEIGDTNVRAINFGGGSPVLLTNPGTLNITTGTLAPSVNSAVFVTPNTLSISSAALVPTVVLNVSINVAALNITSATQAPTPTILITPNVLTISSSAKAPTVSGNALITPSALSIVSAVLGVSIFAGGNVTINVSSLSITSAVQTISLSTSALISVNTLNISSALLAASSSVGNTVSVNTLTITSAVLSPVVSGNALKVVGALSITSSINAPQTFIVVVPNTLNITSSAKSPVASTIKTVTVSLSTLVITSGLLGPTVTAAKLSFIPKIMRSRIEHYIKVQSYKVTPYIFFKSKFSDNVVARINISSSDMIGSEKIINL